MKLVQECYAEMSFPLMITVFVATLTVIMRENGIAAQHFLTNFMVIKRFGLVFNHLFSRLFGEKLGCPWLMLTPKTIMLSALRSLSSPV